MHCRKNNAHCVAHVVGHSARRRAIHCSVRANCKVNATGILGAVSILNIVCCYVIFVVVFIIVDNVVDIVVVVIFVFIIIVVVVVVVIVV